MEPIAMIMTMRRLEWFGHVKRRCATENIRAVVEMKMEGKRPRGKPTMQTKHNIKRDLNNNREELATDREIWKRSLYICVYKYMQIMYK